MIAIQLDPTGSHYIRWPETAGEIISLARRYTARQAALPTTAQIKDVPLATVQDLLAQVESAVTSATHGEISRAIATETLRQRVAQAKPLLDRIIMRLKLTHGDNLARLEAWGLATIQGLRGVTVRKPYTPKEYRAFLRAYIAHESTLIEGQQITDPPLETLEALLEDMEEALANRTDGCNQRELGVEQRNEAQAELLQWLKTAGIILVMQNGRTVSNALQQHGFTVVERSPHISPKGNGETANEEAK